MSGTQNKGKAPATAAAGEKAKAKRVVGPRTVFVIFKEGTDPALVEQMKSAVDTLTMNGRVLLRNLQGGNVRPFLSYTVHVEPKDGDKEGE